MADRNGYIGRAPGDSSVTVARQTFSPTGVTTDFTFVSGYTVGYLDLFLNGTKLVEGLDYTATDASTISLVAAAVNGDIIEGVAYKAFNLGDARRIGIQSSGALIGSVDTLNFVGTGNTFALNGTTIDVSISAGAGGTWGNYTTGGTIGITTTKKVRIQNNLEVTGVSTFSGFVAFSTSISVGGTVTYEDVTNIDSIGIITARSDVSIADKIIHTGDTNTAIRFPAADTFTVETGGSEAIRVDSSQQLLLGTTSSYAVGSSAAGSLQISGSLGFQSLSRFAANSAGPNLILGKSRNASPGSSTVVQDDDDLGNITFAGDDGTDLQSVAARIVCEVDGTPGSNDMPGRLTFHTTSDGAASPTERVRIDSSGNVLINNDTYPTTGTFTDLSKLVVNGSYVSITRDEVATSITANEDIGAIAFGSKEGREFAWIRCNSTGSATNSSTPGYITFSTTAASSTTPTERLRITSAGRFGFNTTSPDYTVDINGELGITEGQPVTWHDGSGNAAAQIYGDSSSNLIFRTGVAAMGERMRLLPAGGLTFNGDTAAANALDDYEEGTFTPTASGFSVSGTTTMTGQYVKVGRQVTVGIKFVNTGTIAHGISCNISLPFSMAAGTEANGLIGMLDNANGTAFNSNKSGTQCKLDGEGGARFFVGSFTTTSSGANLLFGGTYIAGS